MILLREELGILSFLGKKNMKPSLCHKLQQLLTQNLFDEGCCFVSFDVELLFTNVRLKRTISVVLKCVFEDKLINTTLSKCSLKKLLFDCAIKTAIAF